MQKVVYLLEHNYERDDCEHVKCLGIYSSYEAAEHAVELYRKLPGFCDWPDCFVIDEYTIDEMCWETGFVYSD